MKILNIFLISSLFLLSAVFTSVSQSLTEESEITIITCAPGSELYSTFGHTAIRVKDPVNRIDKVYNYGTFNFNTPNFYLKFTRGKLDYMLTVSPYRYFVIEYMNEKRWIKEQVLNLNQKQKKQIFDFLQNNALPDNMYYRYDFFYDNCATRVKDVVKNVLQQDIIMPKSITHNDETFRDLLGLYLENKSWERYGINLILGQPADKVVNAEEATFLPDFHELFFDSCKIVSDGNIEPLVIEKRMIYDPKEETGSKNFFTPALLFWLFFSIVAIFTIIEFRKRVHYIILDKTILFFTGFVGFVILLVWFGTEHTAVVNNWDIIWAMPLYFIAAFLLKSKDNLPCIRIFMLIWSVMLLISLFIDITFYNMFDFASIPLILILILRTPLIYFLRK
jgi:hypothetical protein